MVNLERRGVRRVLGERGQRHHTAAAGRQIDVLQPFRVLPERRRGLHDHVVLVQLRVHRRDLTLAERVVERAIDRADRQAQPRRLVAIDDDVLLQAGVIDVAADTEAGSSAASRKSGITLGDFINSK